MKAFKQFGIDEYEYDYVHEHLVPTLVSNLGLEINEWFGYDLSDKECPLFESLLTITPCSLIVLCTEGYLVGKLQHEIKA